MKEAGMRQLLCRNCGQSILDDGDESLVWKHADGSRFCRDGKAAEPYGTWPDYHKTVRRPELVSGEPPRAEPPCTSTWGFSENLEVLPDSALREAGSRPSAPAPSGEPLQKQWEDHVQNFLRQYENPLIHGALNLLWILRPKNDGCAPRYPWHPTENDFASSSPADLQDAARLAQFFHETYERLAPDFGYETRKESAKPWNDVPEKNRNLMIAVCREVLAAFAAAVREGR